MTGAPGSAPPQAAAAGQARAGPIRLCANADARSVRQVLGLVTHRVSGRLSHGAAEIAQMVIAEVLNNIVEHAYHGRGGPVVLRIRQHGGVLVVSIADRGAPLPDSLLGPQGAPMARLAEGGFGWPIIHHFARRMSYRRIGCWNRLRFCLPLEAAVS
ncbi:ATP-binding protein [Frigidibacter sp. MR17.14]|uniref:ATP-binding protein n=1 Tax=Frigidibacter sp. MR17.14 TaxID=3126509 RepID=UPI003012EBEE